MAQVIPRNLQEIFDNMSDNDNSDNESTEIDDSSLNEKKEEEKKEPINIHELLAEPIQCCSTYGECPICYDELNMINITVTRCGHIMHSSCIFTSLETYPSCPMCRTQLMRDDEEEDEDQEEYQGEGEEEDQDQEEEIEGPTLEQLTNKMLNMGYTSTDLLAFFLQGLARNHSDNKAKYTEDFFEKMDSSIDGLLDGTISLSSRDTRTYADVAKKATTTPITTPVQAQV